jgi:hypothetical protein
LLLLFGLLLEILLLLLGLLHPLLDCLLEDVLLLFGLPEDVRTWGVEELHVGVHQLLHHLLGVLLLLLYLLGECLHLIEPLPSVLRCLPSPVCVLGHHFLHPRVFPYVAVHTQFKHTGIRKRPKLSTDAK